MVKRTAQRRHVGAHPLVLPEDFFMKIETILQGRCASAMNISQEVVPDMSVESSGSEPSSSDGSGCVLGGGGGHGGANAYESDNCLLDDARRKTVVEVTRYRIDSGTRCSRGFRCGQYFRSPPA